MKIVLYECDPSKNTECGKRCLEQTEYRCHSTVHPEFARLDCNGDPVISYVREMNGNGEEQIYEKVQ